MYCYKDLRRALDLAKRLIPKSANLPILQCVRIVEDGQGGMVVQATDLDSGIQLKVLGQCLDIAWGVFLTTEATDFCVNLPSLLQLVKSINDKNTRFQFEVPRRVPDPADPDKHWWQFADGSKLDDFKVRVWWGTTGPWRQLLLPTMDPAEFPKLDFSYDAGTIAHFDDALPVALRSVVGFLSTDETRPALNGICVRQRDGSFAVCGSDGIVLREAVVPMLGVPQKPVTEAIWPPAVVSLLKGVELSGWLAYQMKEYKQYYNAEGVEINSWRVEHRGEQPARTEMTAEPKSLLFELADGSMVGFRLIEGPFASYERIIPTGYCWQVRVDPVVLLEAVRRLHTASDVIDADRWRGKVCALRMCFQSDNVTLSLHYVKSGPEETLPCELVSADVPLPDGGAVVGFNAKLLELGLTAITGDGSSAILGLQSDAAAAVVVLQAEGSSNRNLVMPLRLEDTAPPTPTPATDESDDESPEDEG